jgi:hypothetical protein
MANTFKKIQTVTVGSGGASSIDFTSIPQTYTDLKIVVSAKNNRAADTQDHLLIGFNGGTTSITNRQLIGISTTPSSSTSVPRSVGTSNSTDSTASVFSNTEIYIPNYTSANNKSYSADSVTEINSTSDNFLSFTAGLWSSTAAITSISLTSNIGTALVQYTTATLYGVSNAANTSVGAYATGGNQIYTDNTYWYHVFTSSGTFTPARSLTADYLVIAGGGGGGGNFAGGGGAGGTRCTVGATGGGGSLESALSLTATAYTVTVGAGGPGDSGSGTNSVFGSITSTAGGLGGGGTAGGDTPGSAGGSGGGGGGVNGSVNTNPNSGGTRTASPVQGNNGGVGRFNRVAGGGGGAGAVGGSASGTTAGAGGNGITTSISGTSTTYAGGGGGGSLSPTGNGNSGGTGGGGNGTNSGAVSGSGTVNTGSGGGGGPGNGSGGAGGSGIVIVRYTI